MSAPGASPEPSSFMLGFLWIVLATALFTATNTFAKLLGQHHDIVQVVWARYTFHLVFIALLLRQAFPATLKTRHLKLQLGRSVLLLVSSGLYFTGFTLLPLADSAAMLNITPLLVTVLSVPLLGERVGIRRSTGVILGFIGALIIIRPGMDAFTTAALFPLSAAFTYALYQLATRHVSHADSSMTSITYTALAGAVIGGCIVPFFWTTPDAAGWAMMFGIGISGGIGHYAMIRAYSVAEISAVVPFTYTVLIWMIASGYFIFGDLPDIWTLVGTLIIVGSGLYITRREAAVKKVGTA